MRSQILDINKTTRKGVRKLNDSSPEESALLIEEISKQTIDNLRHILYRLRTNLSSPQPKTTTSNPMFNKIDRPFLLASTASLIVSVVLWFLVNREYGLFVGLWVPSILALWVGVRVILLTHSVNRTRRNAE